MATYSDKLKDPRWQKKRLEVLSKHEFSCEICGNGEATLHVHHKEYFKGREPWEYDNAQLACICKDCHKSEHDDIDPLKLVSSYLDMDGPCGRSDFATIMIAYAGGWIDFTDVLKENEHLISSPYSYAIGSIAASFRDEFSASELYALSKKMHESPSSFRKSMFEFTSVKPPKKSKKGGDV